MKIIIILILLSYLASPLANAATIKLINGKTIEGDLVEATEDYVTIKLDTTTGSFPVKFYNDEITDLKISKKEKQYPLSKFTDEEKLEGAVSRITDIFYLDSNPDLLINHLKLLLTRNPRIVTLPEKWDHLSHFYATAFQKWQDKSNELEILANSLPIQTKNAVERIIDNIKNYSPITRPNDSKDLDFLWAEFIATGEKEPVEKIIDVLAYTINDFNLNTLYWKQYELSESDKELALKALRESAKWSLEANAKKHRRVYEIIEEQYKSSKSKELKEILRRTKIRITEKNWIKELLRRAENN